METITSKRLTLETRRQNLEVLRPENVVYLGRLAIRSEYLGINDPVTHLYRYLERGDASLIGIREDIETDISERLPETPFINQVEFNHNGGDFISKKDKVSMRDMTKVNLQIFTDELLNNPSINEELQRAESEAFEVEKLDKWFNGAMIGEYMIFESLPIGSQQFAVSRIYQKISESKLHGNFISLYSPSVDTFNELRKDLGFKTAGSTAAEILNNEYVISNKYSSNSAQFIDNYVELYDQKLQDSTGKSHIFGIQVENRSNVVNGLQKVRNQPKLTSIYLETVKTLANSQGEVTYDLLEITEKLGINNGLYLGQGISVDLARAILRDVIRGISGVIDRADSKLLSDLEDSSNAGSGANYAAASHFGAQARSTGMDYGSNGCPEISRSDKGSNTDTGPESNIIKATFGARGTLDGFGQAKIGICRIANCPSRGESSWWINRTLVGGCDVCVNCHKIFNKGKSPEKIHAMKKITKPQKAA